MALTPVTDPELLNQLGSPSGNLTPVSDPDILRQLNGEQEDPGILKSLASGAMSGIPLAESAIAGVKSFVNDTPYAKEHDALEALKDASWDAHPVAYGAGKTAGLVGTGLVAPAGIPGAVAVGAASGLDAASDVSEMPKAIAEGAAAGGVLGTIGEKVISPLVSKIPGVTKSVLGTLGTDTTSEGIQSYLNNPGVINSAPGPVAQSEVLQTVANGIRQKVSKLSEKAMSKLNPESYTTMDELKPAFDTIRQGLMTDGESGPVQQAAIGAVEQWEEMLSRIGVRSEANNGVAGIPETTLGQVIRDIDANTNWADQSQAVTNKALKELRHSLDSALKTANPEYAEAMKPAAETAKLLSNLQDHFNLKNEPTKGLVTTDTTNSKMANVLNENKSHAQDVLKQAGETSGVNFLENAANYKTQQSFQSGSGAGLRTVLSGLGIGAGSALGHPWIGGTMGGAIAHNLDGGAIAKGILDTYLKGSKAMADAGISSALQKYGPMLVSAAKQGGNELAATHFVLATSHPEYQALVNHMQDNSSH